MALRVKDENCEEVGERSIEERQDGKQYALIDYGAATDGDVVFRSRFDHNGRDEEGRPCKISYMVEVAFLHGAPIWATFGQWEKGDATRASHWRKKKTEKGAGDEANSSPDVETIYLDEKR